MTGRDGGEPFGIKMNSNEGRVMSGESPVRRYAGTEPEEELGGDPVCWAHLVCPECGAIVSEGHRDGCGITEQGTDLP
jgi:hypothetical protein